MGLSSDIKDEEHLYRVVKRSRPDCMINKRVSPGLFKEKDGVSVDRDGGRTLDEIISFITSNTFGKRAKGIVELSAGDCFSIEVNISSDPSDNNPYHANMWLDMTDENKYNLQALRLADMCNVVFYDEDIAWI